MNYRKIKAQPQAINEAEKQIEQFFINLDPERFSAKARKKSEAHNAQIKDVSLSAKKLRMKLYKRR